MALQIEKVLINRFEFSLDGGTVVSTIYPRLFTDGTKCHFKTSTGANIIKNQNVDVTEVTVIDTYGSSGTFTFANVQELWAKLNELDFWGETSGGGVTTFAALSDTDTYFGNDGKIPIVNESELKLDYTTFYNYNEFVQLDDVSIASLIDGKIVGVTLVGGVPKITLVEKPIDGTTYFSAVGGFDYNDSATSITPLVYTTGYLQLTNDIVGIYTFLSQPPYGITSVWNESTNTFDFSQLSIGDEVLLRIHIAITTSVSNQDSELRILFGEGTADEYALPIDTDIAFKTAGFHEIMREIRFYIGNENWRISPAKILFSSDANANIIVYGWHPYIIRKSINILDVNDDNFKTFSVSQVASQTVDVSTNAGTVKIGYEGTFNKITNILFNKEFSSYLSEYASLITTNQQIIKIYNKTKKISLIANITSFDYTDISNVYYNVSISDNLDYTDVSVNDVLEFDISVSPLQKIKIGLYWVDKNGNTDINNIEVGDFLEGWIESNTRYVVGKVIGLPFDINDNTKVSLAIDNYI